MVLTKQCIVQFHLVIKELKLDLDLWIYIKDKKTKEEEEELSETRLIDDSLQNIEVQVETNPQVKQRGTLVCAMVPLTHRV